jgi:hypothetical protein
MNLKRGLAPRPCALAAVLCGYFLGPAVPFAHGQTTSQFWGNVTFGWSPSNQLRYGIDVEPKFLLSAPSGDPGWWSIENTPALSYSPTGRLELLGQLATIYTKQTDDVRSFEVTPRVGFTWHLFSRDLSVVRRVPELEPLRRVVLRDTVRFEARNIYYSGGDTEQSHKVRFRNRFEFLVPVNKPKLSDDKALCLQADWEYFFPLGNPSERFANDQRIRAGVGYRRNRDWRVEALYIWNRSRNTIGDGFTTNDNIVNIRLERSF